MGFQNLTMCGKVTVRASKTIELGQSHFKCSLAAFFPTRRPLARQWRSLFAVPSTDPFRSYVCLAHLYLSMQCGLLGLKLCHLVGASSHADLVNSLSCLGAGMYHTPAMPPLAFHSKPALSLGRVFCPSLSHPCWLQRVLRL